MPNTPHAARRTLVVLAVAVVGFFIFSLQRNPDASIGGGASSTLKAESLRGVRVEREVVSLPLPKAESGVATQSVVWSRDTMRGELDAATIARTIAAGNGEMLEGRLKPPYQEALARELAALDASMVEIGELYVAEVARVKAQLIDDPARTVLIRTRPRESDPNYAKLLQARLEVESPSLGAVWADVDKKTRHEIHFVIKWADWPGLRQIVDSQVFYVAARAEMVRAWITRTYYDTPNGETLFDNS